MCIRDRLKAPVAADDFFLGIGQLGTGKHLSLIHISCFVADDAEKALQSVIGNEAWKQYLALDEICNGHIPARFLRR